MTTVAPPGPVASAPLARRQKAYRAIEEKRLDEVLRAWRAQLWTQQILQWTSNGAIAGILLACFLLLISRFVPWAGAFTWAISVAVVAVLCSLGAALWFRPSLDHIARWVDAHLALHDRLSTAWELRNDPGLLPGLQRRDALTQLGRHTPGAALPLRLRPTRLIITAAGVIALILLLVLPNPMNSVLQQQAAFHKQMVGEIALIQHIRTVIALSAGKGSRNQPNLSPQELAQIDKILQELQSKLAQAQNETQAQQILAQAQAQLNHLRDPNAAGKAQALATASALLQNSSNANLSAVGKALASGDLKGLANALQQLASQLKNMTPAQREQLAQQFEQAANQIANNDPQLSAALRQLATSIADNNQQEVANALERFENAAAQDIASQAATNTINQASQTLQNLANALASPTDNGSSQSPGQSPGQSLSPGQSQGNSDSSNQGNTGNKAGKNEQVFIPGQTSSGQTATGGNGDNSTTGPGNSVPYSQVIAQYEQMAHDDIDNSNIPPDLKDLIYSYYNSLEGQH